jgi:NAD(P)-dependent dehydrogenase (short-subunit alcohol dehydrogenase family)
VHRRVASVTLRAAAAWLPARRLASSLAGRAPCVTSGDSNARVDGVWPSQASVRGTSPQALRPVSVRPGRAGTGDELDGRVLDTPIEEVRRVIEVALLGTIAGTRAALARMADGGTVINIGSIESKVPMPLTSAYAAAKHGLKTFTESARMELAADRRPIDMVLVMPNVSSPRRSPSRCARKAKRPARRTVRR